MDETKKLVETIIQGIQDKKGHGIVIANLSGIDGTICRYFVICHGNSPQQVEAIAESVSDYVREHRGEKPVNCAGLGNNQWVAIDFVGRACSHLRPRNARVLRLGAPLGRCRTDGDSRFGLAIHAAGQQFQLSI